MNEENQNEMNEVDTHKEYLVLQTHKLRQWALIVGSVFTLITIVMDYIRFPSELSQVTIALRFVFMFIPLTWLTYEYMVKPKSNKRIHLALLFYITVASGLIHSYIYYSANVQGVYFPKAGIAILLIYAGLLFAMPIILSALSSLIIIIQAGFAYYLNQEFINDIIVLMVFYGMISVCCILINFVSIKILSKNYKLLNIIKNQAHTDELTGLYNRRFFYLEAKKRAKQAMRDHLDYAVIAIDLDHFKSLNDNFGHKYGDEALVNFCEILSSQCQRPFDFATRMGGDEFVLFLYGTNKDYIEKLCLGINNELQNLRLKVTKNNSHQYLSTSIGAVIVSSTLQRKMHLNEALEKADDLLYEVKNEAKNNFKLIVLTA